MIRLLHIDFTPMIWYDITIYEWKSTISMGVFLLTKNNLPEPRTRISHDQMEGFLTLPTRNEGDAYTLEEVMAAINKGGLRFGLDQERILEMVNKRIYSREMVVARGKQVVHGQDGSYHYYFSTKFDNKPSELLDGSVDYWNIHAIETVEEGQIIAKYSDPIPGVDGMTVNGKLLLAKKGKPCLPLVGKGFKVEEDEHTYVATISGKIERNANRITIAPVYELYGDAGVQTGNIEFKGDVIVHGNVRPGIKIKATGSVTVDGTAEQCVIDAGRDIVLRGGLLGGQKAVLKSKGNIYAKFFEYSTVEASGFIEADSSLNSNLTSYDKIYMNGHRASIVGGSVYGACGVEANCIGNISEVRTEVQAGVHKDIAQRISTLEYTLNEANDIVKKISEGITIFDDMAREKGIDGRKDPRRVALMRTKIVKQAEITADYDEFMRLKDIAERGKGATIKVIQEVYAGSVISIDDMTKVMKDLENSVIFAQRGENIVMLSMKGEVVG